MEQYVVSNTTMQLAASVLHATLSTWSNMLQVSVADAELPGMLQP